MVSTFEKAHAKVNLALAVGPAEPPRGYHPIASLFACVEFGGEVWIERGGDAREASTFSTAWAADAPVKSAIDWPVEKDLGFRALRALEARVGRGLGVRVRVSKRVPVGGGLGGGSSEAAAVLRGVNRACGLGLSGAELAEIGATLGADVAFFAGGDGCGAAVVEGFGERMRPVEMQRLRLVLLCMPFGCATGPVYQAFDAEPARGLRAERLLPLVEAAGRGDVRDALLFNDLAEAAMVVQPRLREVREAITRRSGCAVHVTGSGSTLFVVARDEAQERAVLGAAREIEGVCAVVTSTV